MMFSSVIESLTQQLNVFYIVLRHDPLNCLFKNNVFTFLLH